jgi:subtilisin family serine protease
LKGVRVRFLITSLHFMAGLLFWASVVHGQPVSDVVPGEYIIKLKPDTMSQVQGKLQGKAFLKAAFAAKGTFQISDADPGLIEELKADPEVLYVEPNFRLQSIQPEVHGQALTPDQVAALSTEYYDQTAAPVRATEAWAASSAYSGSNRPIVAIIDTGLDRNHSVFTQSNAIWTNPNEIPGNGVDDDFNGYTDDVNGWNFVSNNGNVADDENHGTHVAGIVLGATQDILSGAAQPAKIRLMALKFLDSTGAGTTSSAINAIYYAVDKGAKVINCSWGGGGYSRALHDAISHAYSRGVLVVTAAGNYSSNNDVTPIYPSNYDAPSNISVAATSDSDRLASFSNYGASVVHVGAPGVLVYSTLPGGWFSSLSGTSMAAPFVAGAAALALREAPQLSGYQLRNLVVTSANPVSYLNGKVASGARINVENMVNTAKTLASAVSYQPDYTPLYQAERSTASTSAANGVGGCGMVSAIGGAALSGGGGAAGGNMGLALAVLFVLPILVWFNLRSRNPLSQRRFERYSLKSDLVIKSGGRELVGTLSTISMGGVAFNVDEALERGGSVQLKITGPNGQEAVEVEGRIVWSERNQSYGVQFSSVREQARAILFGWTRQLAGQTGS